MCNKNTPPNLKTSSMSNKGTTVSLNPSRKTRTKTRKPKFLSIRLDISPEENLQQSGEEMAPQQQHHHHHQLNLFPLHPGNLVEDNKDMHDDSNMAYFFNPDGGSTTLNGVLTTTNTTTTVAGDDSLMYACGRQDSDDQEGLVKAALRNKERDTSEEKWVCYSEVVEEKKKRKLEEEVSSSCAVDIRLNKNEMQQGLSLKLDYQVILNTWSDKGPLYIEGGECPQTVPDLHDDFLTHDGASALVDGWGGIGSSGLWRVPEMGGSIKMEEEASGGREIWKMEQRATSVLRYKEKRQNRLFSKRIRYQVRKLNAEKRPRMKGRFVKRN